MTLEKVLYIIGTAFFIIFILSAILILSNTLNMWLVGIVSLLISTLSFIIIKIMKNKTNK